MAHSRTIRNMLILKASNDIEVCETSLVKGVASMYELDVQEVEVRSEDDLVGSFADGSHEWDIVYACGHGNVAGIGNAVEDERFIRWDELTASLCDDLAKKSWFFLACCRGGLEKVAYKMFCGCPNLDYIFGPRWNAKPAQLACAFHVLLHNFADQQVEPLRAAERASEAIDLTIRAFDRGEVEATDAFVQWCDAQGYNLFDDNDSYSLTSGAST